MLDLTAMPSLSDVRELVAAAKLIERIAGGEIERIERVLPAALLGSREAAATYVDAYRELLAAYLRELAVERPDLVAPSENGYAVPTTKPAGDWWIESLEQRAITAPFSPWVRVAGPGRGIAIALLADTREAILGLDPMPLPTEPTALPDLALSAGQLTRFRRAVSDELAGDTPPLRTVRRVFGLTKSELGALFGVTRQAAAQWLDGGVPGSRSARVLTVAEIAEQLDHNLKSSQIPAIVRRPAAAYGGRTMLDVIAAGEERWLLDDVTRSFDYSSTA